MNEGWGFTAEGDKTHLFAPFLFLSRSLCLSLSVFETTKVETPEPCLGRRNVPLEVVFGHRCTFVSVWVFG